MLSHTFYYFEKDVNKILPKSSQNYCNSCFVDPWLRLWWVIACRETMVVDLTTIVTEMVATIHRGQTSSQTTLGRSGLAAVTRMKTASIIVISFKVIMIAVRDLTTSRIAHVVEVLSIAAASQITGGGSLAGRMMTTSIIVMAECSEPKWWPNRLWWTSATNNNNSSSSSSSSSRPIRDHRRINSKVYLASPTKWWVRLLSWVKAWTQGWIYHQEAWTRVRTVPILSCEVRGSEDLFTPLTFNYRIPSGTWKTWRFEFYRRGPEIV